MFVHNNTAAGCPVRLNKKMSLYNNARFMQRYCGNSQGRCQKQQGVNRSVACLKRGIDRIGSGAIPCALTPLYGPCANPPSGSSAGIPMLGHLYADKERPGQDVAELLGNLPPCENMRTQPYESSCGVAVHTASLGQALAQRSVAAVNPAPRRCEQDAEEETQDSQEATIDVFAATMDARMSHMCQLSNGPQRRPTFFCSVPNKQNAKGGDGGEENVAQRLPSISCIATFDTHGGQYQSAFDMPITTMATADMKTLLKGEKDQETTEAECWQCPMSNTIPEHPTDGRRGRLFNQRRRKMNDGGGGGSDDKKSVMDCVIGSVCSGIGALATIPEKEVLSDGGADNNNNNNYDDVETHLAQNTTNRVSNIKQSQERHKKQQQDNGGVCFTTTCRQQAFKRRVCKTLAPDALPAFETHQPSNECGFQGGCIGGDNGSGVVSQPYGTGKKYRFSRLPSRESCKLMYGQCMPNEVASVTGASGAYNGMHNLNASEMDDDDNNVVQTTTANHDRPYLGKRARNKVVNLIKTNTEDASIIQHDLIGTVCA